MTPSALRFYLHEQIPLSRAMSVEVMEASANQVVLEAPLEPNLNMHGTMFGGSAATLALLAAWSVCHLRLDAEGVAAQLVIHRTSCDFLLPVSTLARATARFDADWDSFQVTYKRRGKARLTIGAEIVADDAVALRFVGEFVAIADR